MKRELNRKFDKKRKGEKKRCLLVYCDGFCPCGMCVSGCTVMKNSKMAFFSEGKKRRLHICVQNYRPNPTADP